MARIIRTDDAPCTAAPWLTVTAGSPTANGRAARANAGHGRLNGQTGTRVRAGGRGCDTRNGAPVRRLGGPPAAIGRTARASGDGEPGRDEQSVQHRDAGEDDNQLHAAQLRVQRRPTATPLAVRCNVELGRPLAAGCGPSKLNCRDTPAFVDRLWRASSELMTDPARRRPARPQQPARRPPTDGRPAQLRELDA